MKKLTILGIEIEYYPRGKRPVWCKTEKRRDESKAN